MEKEIGFEGVGLRDKTRTKMNGPYSSRVTSTVIDIFSGSIGGMCGLLVGHPFDLVKVRVQQQLIKGSTLDIVTTTARKEGVRAFWKGVTTPLIFEGFLNMMYFGIFSAFSKYVFPTQGYQGFSPGQAFLAGGSAGLLGSFFVTISDIVKINAQLDIEIGTSRRTPRVIVQDIYSQKGMRGFLRGWSTTVLRDIPGFATYFGFYFWLRDVLARNFVKPEDQPPASDNPHAHQPVPMPIQFFSGAVAGLISWGIVYPIDVVKTEMQSKWGENVSALATLRKFWHPQNRHLLVKGITPSLAGSIPACGVTFLVYENLVMMANNQLYSD
eukprot:TRINITY_DN4506_c0_g1_i2.p1 TRINITY_DN4506_c0_g1~~TRINITY_DN4506_c0_g1_i2.p1  ORF type:complete len:326 (+),score=49.96 TRINITY_DN4506_c0_g1_i2:81-1058(+)